MIKQVSLFRKRADLDDKQFFRYWRETHPQVVLQLPGFQRYVQNHALSLGDSPYDGIAEVWLDSMETMRANADCDELVRVRQDENNFIDTESMQSLICEESVIIDGDLEDAEIKTIVLVPKLDPVEPETFRNVYRDDVGPLVRANPHVHRYVQAYCRLGYYRDGRRPVYDAVSALWFTSAEDQQKAFTHPSLAGAPAPEATIMDRSGIGFMPVKEIRIL